MLLNIDKGSIPDKINKGGIPDKIKYGNNKHEIVAE